MCIVGGINFQIAGVEKLFAIDGQEKRIVLRVMWVRVSSSRKLKKKKRKSKGYWYNTKPSEAMQSSEKDAKKECFFFFSAGCITNLSKAAS